MVATPTANHVRSASRAPVSNPDRRFWSGRSVFVTGHTGFKGSWLTLWLTHLGANVTGFSLAPEVEPNLFDLAVRGCPVTTRLADVRDITALKACFAQAAPNIVLHLAAQALVRPSYADPVGTYETNVMGTVNVLEAVRATPSVTAVVIVTSDKAYENREWVWSYRETEPMGGHDPYSSSKGCAELVTSAYRSSFFRSGGHSARIASARAGNVIGGGDWAVDRLVPDVIRAFVEGRSVEIRSPNAIRPWQHVLEPLCGYLRLAECLAGAGGERFAEAWNFGPPDMDCQPVRDLVGTMARSWGEGASWRLSPGEHQHEAGSLKVDASKARMHLQWDRRLPIDEALGWTTEWYRAQHGGAAAIDLTLAQIVRYEALFGRA